MLSQCADRNHQIGCQDRQEAEYQQCDKDVGKPRPGALRLDIQSGQVQPLAEFIGINNALLVLVIRVGRRS
jgi:hypothetical protein